MGKKAEAGTPKFLANKMKAKGLQKLRWYCQMCQKQCRDENGFKCHTMSESHQRQLLLFADSSGRYLDSFSQEFATGYLEILRRQFGTRRVAANKVYQDYISDRNHLHMNATKWLSLTGFVKFLGKTGQCVVDETEKGWYITYIDRDPETLERQEKLAKKHKMDKDDQERLMDFIEKQIEKGKNEDGETSEPEKYSELVRENEEEKIKLNINIAAKVKPEPVRLEKRKIELKQDQASSSREKKVKSHTDTDSGKKLSALDEIMKKEEQKKEKYNRKDYWLAEGIVVKLTTKALGDKYYKEKGVVLEVIDKYSGKIKLIETGEKIKIDQAHVETVIPNIGKNIRIVNGAYRDSIAILKSLDEDSYSVNVEIASGPLKGRLVNNVQYEDICKMY